MAQGPKRFSLSGGGFGMVHNGGLVIQDNYHSLQIRLTLSRDDLRAIFEATRAFEEATS